MNHISNSVKLFAVACGIALAAFVATQRVNASGETGEGVTYDGPPSSVAGYCHPNNSICGISRSMVLFGYWVEPNLGPGTDPGSGGQN